MIRLSFCLFFLGLFFSEPLIAQVVNIEDKRVDLEDTVHFSGFANADFSLYQSDNTLLSVNGNIQMEYGNKKSFILSLTNYQLVKSGSEHFLNNGFQHFRYNYTLQPWLIYELFSQGQYNEQISVLFRGLIGTGLRYKIPIIKNQKVFVGTAMMWEYNSLKDTNIIRRDWRISSYISVNFTFGKTLGFVSTTYFQPLLSDFESYRISSQSSLLISLSKHMQFTSEFIVSGDFNKYLPKNITKIIYSISNGIRWNF